MTDLVRGISAFLETYHETFEGPFFRRVLVVDDDSSMRRFVANVLTTAGYEVDLATNADDALEAAEQRSPDFLITDWNMPGNSGLELCRQLRSRSSTQYVYIIMLTVREEIKELVQGIASGADDYLTKPVHPGALLCSLESGARVLELQWRLGELARRDSLTRLFNRRTLLDVLEQQWALAVREDRPLSCVMLDVDRFKEINDTYGHRFGDEALKAVSKVLTQVSRKQDCLARYGGEEFIALLVGTDGAGARAWAERCRAALEDESIRIEDKSVRVTISAGVSTRSAASTSPEAMLDQADQALLIAKSGGRNKVVVWR